MKRQLEIIFVFLIVLFLASCNVFYPAREAIENQVADLSYHEDEEPPFVPAITFNRSGIRYKIDNGSSVEYPVLNDVQPGNEKNNFKVFLNRDTNYVFYLDTLFNEEIRSGIMPVVLISYKDQSPYDSPAEGEKLTGTGFTMSEKKSSYKVTSTILKSQCSQGHDTFYLVFQLIIYKENGDDILQDTEVVQVTVKDTSVFASTEHILSKTEQENAGFEEDSFFTKPALMTDVNAEVKSVDSLIPQFNITCSMTQETADSLAGAAIEHYMYFHIPVLPDSNAGRKYNVDVTVKEADGSSYTTSAMNRTKVTDEGGTGVTTITVPLFIGYNIRGMKIFFEIYDVTSGNGNDSEHCIGKVIVNINTVIGAS